MSRLSKDEAAQVIAIGDHDGRGFMADIKRRVEGFDTEEEKLLWWAAFLGYMGGICAASVGPGSLQAIQNMTAQTTARLLQGRTN